MERLKTFLIYALLIIGFYFLSNILIFLALNVNYDKISSKSDVSDSQVQVNSAEATLVNGRIRGTITNNEDNDLSGKYMKVDLYSARDVLLGTKYYEIGDLDAGETEDFSVFFKAQDVDYYDISIVDEIDKAKEKLFSLDGKEIFLNEDLKYPLVLGAVILALFL
jgi:hypothetical protein